MYLAKGQRARWVGDNAMTDWFALPEEVTGAALAKARTPLTIQWGMVRTPAEAEALKAVLSNDAPDVFDDYG